MKIETLSITIAKRVKGNRYNYEAILHK